MGKPKSKKRKSSEDEEEEEEEEKPLAKKKAKKEADKKDGEKKPKKKKKDEEEEEPHEDGVKWETLVHNGPYFPPEYEPLPDNVHFYYDGKRIKLSTPAEEVATFY